ncbi:unnamed protein product [Ilex paraguariensis]|uniref:DUF7356 domain-containing protein n=1 Tax=Ilex paraguariensis TaxID=185542 RepID=A0ABC8QQF8_9AQUA
MCRRRIFIVLLLTLLVPWGSNAYLIEMFRRLTEGHNPKVEPKPLEEPPSPSPVSSTGSNASGGGVDKSGKRMVGDGEVPANSPKQEPNGEETNETCEKVSRKCTILNTITACVPHVGSGPQGSFLILQNEGDNFLNVRVTILPVNDIFEAIELSGHQVKKVNTSANSGSSSISINANGNCLIPIGAPVKQGNFYQQFPYASYATSVNGVYLLFATALIIGGIWACCKLGSKTRHLDAVPYKELEMGQPESRISMNEETAEGWDQDWDDGDWDEEKAVKPTGVNHVGNGLANGHTSRSSNANGWGNDWDD